MARILTLTSAPQLSASDTPPPTRALEFATGSNVRFTHLPCFRARQFRLARKNESSLRSIPKNSLRSFVISCQARRIPDCCQATGSEPFTSQEMSRQVRTLKSSTAYLKTPLISVGPTCGSTKHANGHSANTTPINFPLARFPGNGKALQVSESRTFYRVNETSRASFRALLKRGVSTHVHHVVRSKQILKW